LSRPTISSSGQLYFSVTEEDTPAETPEEPKENKTEESSGTPTNESESANTKTGLSDLSEEKEKGGEATPLEEPEPLNSKLFTRNGLVYMDNTDIISEDGVEVMQENASDEGTKKKKKPPKQHGHSHF